MTDSAQRAHAPRPMRCPKCKATTDEVEMLHFRPYKSTAYAIVKGVNAHGLVVIDPVDRGDPETEYRPYIECRGCGHQWTNDRDWIRE